MKRLAVFVIALLLCVNATSAETNVCTLHGTITDETGAAIPNTRVLVQWDSSSKWVSGHEVKDASLRADAYGKFSVQLPPGFYDVFVSAPAFSPVAKKLRIEGRVNTLEFRLKIDPGVAAETIGHVVEQPVEPNPAKLPDHIK
jgi:hypothetical protein